MKSISEIKKEFAKAGESELPQLFQSYASDSRSGVSGLIAQYQKKLDALQKERERLGKMRRYEQEYEPFGLVCGVDEAGRGPLAGPVVAAAVILKPDCEILYLNDSKKLSAKRREELFDEIKDKAVTWGVGQASWERIDEINILQATYEAMREAVSKLDPQPQILLNDAVHIPQISLRQLPIIGGDGKSLSIAAASVLAKVTRDRLMRDYDRIYPEYGFAAHKGYGTKAHIEALKKYGPSPIHRKTFIGHFISEDSKER